MSATNPTSNADAAAAIATSHDDVVERLHSQARRDAKIQKVLGGVALLAIVAFVALVYLPSSRRLQSLANDLSDGLREISDQEQRIAAMAGVSVAADELATNLATFRPVPERPMVEAQISEMNVLSRRLKLRDFNIARTPAAGPAAGAASGPRAMPMRVMFVSDFAGAFEFLRAIEQSHQMVRVSELQMTPTTLAETAGSGGGVRVELVLDLFHAPTAG